MRIVVQLSPLSISRIFSSSPAVYFNINHIKNICQSFDLGPRIFLWVLWLEFLLAIFFAWITPIMSSLGFPVSISLKWNKNWKTFGKESQCRILLDPLPPPPGILPLIWKHILNYLTFTNFLAHSIYSLQKQFILLHL